MDEQESLEILTRTGALLRNGHFLLRSGLHSDTFIDKHVIFEHRGETAELAHRIAQEFTMEKIAAVIGPRNGGKILADWVADYLTLLASVRVESVAAEKREGGNGFFFHDDDRKRVAGKRILVVDDILSTGGSVRRTIDATREHNSDVAGLGVLFNRCEFSTTNLADVPKFFALAHVTLDSWPASACPLCREGTIPLQEA